MSVVNKMLRDLDNRKHEQIFTAKSANYVPPKSSKTLWLVILCLGIVSIITASYSAYLLGQTSNDEALKQSPKALEIEQGDQYASTVSPLPKQASIPPKVNKAKEVKLSKTELISYLPAPSPEKIQSFAGPVESISKDVNSNKVIEQPLPAKASEFVVAASDGAKTRLSSLRAEAFIASQKNDDASVVKILHEILSIAPQEMKIRKQLAALLFSKSELGDAKNVLSIGIEQSPTDSSMRLMLSRIFYRLGELDQAFTVLAEHPYSALANDELVSFRAALAEKTGNYVIAQEDYLLLVQRNPNDAKWWLGLGVSQDKQKLSEQAISSYQQAQSLNQLPQQVDTFVAQRIQLLARRS
jgi:MSHA biogenesis protein MshN